MTTFDQVWPVAAFFLGVVSTLLIETIKARRTREEDLRRTSAAREQFFQDRRELDHLLKVNDALSALTKACDEAAPGLLDEVIADLPIGAVAGWARALRRPGKYSKSRKPDIAPSSIVQLSWAGM